MLHRQTHPRSRIALLRRLRCKRGAHFCIAKCTPIGDFLLRMGRETHPSQGFHPSDVQNASVVLCFATRNAPLSKISPFGRRKCKRGAHFCIARYTPIEDFVLRTGTDKHTNIQTHGLTNMQTYKHDAKYYSIVGHGVGGMPRSAIPGEAAKRPSIEV